MLVSRMFMNPGCRSKFHAAGNQNNGLMGIVDPQHHARAPQSATRHVRQLHNNRTLISYLLIVIGILALSFVVARVFCIRAICDIRFMP